MFLPAAPGSVRELAAAVAESGKDRAATALARVCAGSALATVLQTDPFDLG
jgi:hypothetical protein